MTQSRSAVIVFRGAVAALFVLWVFVPGVKAQRAQAASPTAINGVYTGTFADKEGSIKFKLMLTWQQSGTLDGALTCYLPDGAGTRAYTCELKGFYIPAHGTQPNRIQLIRRKWETPPPSRLFYVGGIEGVFDPEGSQGAGQISGRMSGAPAPFEAIRNAAESTNLAHAHLSNNVRPDIQGVFALHRPRVGATSSRGREMR